MGNQTECALLAFVNAQLGELGRSERGYGDVKGKFKVLKMIPFNSETKKMTVVVELEPDQRVRVFTKGASECIIDDCAYVVAGSNVGIANLDLNKRDAIKEQILKHMAQNSLRTIALGYKDMSMAEFRRALGEGFVAEVVSPDRMLARSLSKPAEIEKPLPQEPADGKGPESDLLFGEGGFSSDSENEEG